MHFGFDLELSDIDLWNTDLVDTHLDLLSRDKYTDIPHKYFGCLHKIFKRSSRHVFKTSSRHIFKTSSRHIFKTSSARQFFVFQDVLQKVFARRLQDDLEDVKLLRGRRVEDVFKTCLEDAFKTNKCLLGRLISTKFSMEYLPETNFCQKYNSTESKVFPIRKNILLFHQWTCFRTQFCSAHQTTVADFIFTFIDNSFKKYLTRNKVLIKIRTEIETIGLSCTNIVKKCLINIR